jgi:hypothetical protein
MNPVPLPHLISDRGLRQLLGKQFRGHGKAAAMVRDMGVDGHTVSRYRSGFIKDLSNLVGFFGYLRSAFGR